MFLKKSLPESLYLFIDLAGAFVCTEAGILNICQHPFFLDLSGFPFLMAKQNLDVSIPPPPVAVSGRRGKVDNKGITF